ncbi:response regulator [Pelagicoccus sp. SDUM812003]|uniref:response regulator n=1 Tax=Pelagicoccus sp. SDUM812003 TaxID=3041267 RepID=UPI00280DA950|nr:response regulator [Pelagicoccus sp. SDUM812003]MDQ8203374.1 response regulator [Pelagicoccus sp. SDUM812003]
MKGKMLVIDDEEGMRTLLEALLMSLGIDSICVDSAQDAMRALTERTSEITACLLDMNLEDAKGENLYDRLKEVSPDLAVFPMSGICADEIRERLAGRDIAGLISKPFSASEFSKTVLDGISQTPSGDH